jgi:secretion/DNA translocation related CpaE-like protein
VIARRRSSAVFPPQHPETSRGPSPCAASPRVLVVTADQALADVIRRLAAAAAVEVEVLADPPDVRVWLGCRLAVVGADCVRAVVAQLPRRGDVVLVSLAGHDPHLWEQAVTLGAEQVAVLPDADAWVVDRLAAGGCSPARARVVGVVGGCGGAGASVFASGLAVTAAERGQQVLLADLDPVGGGLDLMLGVDGVPGLRWPDLAGARGRLPSSSVHDALPRLDGLAVLAWGRGEPVDVPAVAVDAVLTSATRTHDLVVLDLPRGGDERLLTAAVRQVHDLLVVVPARLRATAAAAQLVGRWGALAASAGVVVRRSPGDRLSSRAVADAVELPLALEMRDEPRVDTLLDHGEPPALRGRGPLHRACDQWLSRHAGADEAAA